MIGFPGLMATPLKWFDKLKFLIILGTKSNFPAETAPLVITISYLDLKFLLINFLNSMSSLSLKTPPFIMSKNKFFDKDFI